MIKWIALICYVGTGKFLDPYEVPGRNEAFREISPPVPDTLRSVFQALKYIISTGHKWLVCFDVLCGLGFFIYIGS